MESVYWINLIVIFVVNVFFFFSGVCLNSAVIISYWRSVQLRRKLCYFMIMVLSCCDLLGVLTNSPLMAVIAILWLTKKLDVSSTWFRISAKFTEFIFALCLFALLVMNFDRYLATSYPLFHRTSVTKKGLLTLLGILIVFGIAWVVVFSNESVIPFHTCGLDIMILFTPAMLFINYKLFRVTRKTRRSSPNMKKTISLRNISSCSLAVASFVILTIPMFANVGLVIKLKHKTVTLDNDVNLTRIWAVTILSMNSTINCLIFYWKNKVLRTEGWKVLKNMKICQWIHFQPDK